MYRREGAQKILGTLSLFYDRLTLVTSLQHMYFLWQYGYLPLLLVYPVHISVVPQSCLLYHDARIKNHDACVSMLVHLLFGFRDT